MLSNAVPLVQSSPVVIIRNTPTAILKYQVDSTAFVAPEGVVLNDLNLSARVAIREEIVTTSGSIGSYLIY